MCNIALKKIKIKTCNFNCEVESKTQDLNFLEDLKKIDEKYMHIISESKQTALFYELINKNRIFVNKIFKVIAAYSANKPYLNRYIEKIEQHLSDIDYSSCTLIKEKKMHSIAIIACSIVWAFNETSQYKYTCVNDALPHDSYDVHNETIDFIDMFNAWSAAYNKNIILYNIKKKEHNSSVYKIFAILLDAEVFESETNYIPSIKKKKKYYYSKYFHKLKIVKIHTKSLEYKETGWGSFLFGEHYSICWKICIPNENNEAVFKLNKKDVLEIMSKAFTNIDFQHYAEITQLYFNEHKLDKNKLHLEYETYSKEYKAAIRNNNINLSSAFAKKLSVYQKAIELKEILDMGFGEDEKFFLPWNYDFRGRTYYLSDISFTFSKEFRWCMYQGYYENEEDFKPHWHAYNSKIFKILNQQTYLLNELNTTTKNQNTSLQQAIIWLLISLGETNKSKLGEEIKIDQFIKEGIKIFNNRDEILNKFEYEEQIKIITLTKTIKELSEGPQKSKIKKRLISKDAPASVFQHLVLNFGWKNEDVLRKVNLKSDDTWYDIYTMLINLWKKGKTNLNDTEKKILSFFNRKSLKKVIMTSNYGVGYNSAENYFKDIVFNIKANETEEFKLFITSNWKQIQFFLEDFFNFITNLLILETNPNNIINYIGGNNGILLLSDAVIDLNYYKKNSYIVDLLHRGKRYTKSFKTTSSTKDHRKFKTAVRANYIHSLDAALTRWVIRQFGMYTIHDCFLIDPANITYLVSLINEGMNCKFDNYRKFNNQEIEVFSIFIVI